MEKLYNKRTYNKWTKEDEHLLRNGKVPESHPSMANCRAHAAKLGFKFVPTVSGRWSKAQIKMLDNGVIPLNKNLEQCIEQGKKVGVNFLENFFARQSVDLSAMKGLKKDEKMFILRENNQSLKPFKVKEHKGTEKAAKRGKKFFLMHAKSNMSIQDIAETEHCTRQNVHRLIDTFKIHYFNQHCFDAVVNEIVDNEDA